MIEAGSEIETTMLHASINHLDVLANKLRFRERNQIFFLLSNCTGKFFSYRLHANLISITEKKNRLFRNVVKENENRLHAKFVCDFSSTYTIFFFWKTKC